MSLLSTIQRASALAGIAVPTALANADRQMVELARIDAEELAARFDWPGIIREHSFVSAATVDQPEGLPSDFDRFPFSYEMRNTTGNRAIPGPLGSEAWSRLTGQPGFVDGFRIFGVVLQISPAPAAGETITFPYVSSGIYADASGERKTAWTADVDAAFVPEDLIALGVVWRWRKAKGLEYGEDMATAERQIERRFGMTGGGSPIVVLSRQRLPMDAQCAYPGVLGH